MSNSYYENHIFKLFIQNKYKKIMNIALKIIEQIVLALFLIEILILSLIVTNLKIMPSDKNEFKSWNTKMTDITT